MLSDVRALTRSGGHYEPPVHGDLHGGFVVTSGMVVLNELGCPVFDGSQHKSVKRKHIQ